MKVAVLADTHAGVRNNSPVFMSHQIRFFEDVFFPYVQEHGITHMIHLGDVFDRRKDTNNYAIHEWDEKVFRVWNEMFEVSHIIIGNHDTYFKNTNLVNTPERFLSRYENFTFYTNPCERELYGVKTLVLPWICEENENFARKLIDESDAALVLGHLEVIGSPMFRGIENIDKGFDPLKFTRFKKVLSGHFHLKSNQKNIFYLGSPYATMWSEAFDSRGFHILDTETLKLNFIENTQSPFVHIEYESGTAEVPPVKGKIVRVLVKSKASESSFLEFLESVESQGPAEINVTEPQAVSTIDSKLDESLDMFSLMDVYVDSLTFDSPKEELKKLLRDLYQESLNLHDITE